MKGFCRSTLWLCVVMVGILTSSFSTHKFYVSNTICEFNPRSGQFEVTCKLFTDDLERALGYGEDKPMRLGTDREISGANSLIENYINQHLHFKLNNQPANIRFVGKEAEADLTFCYFEFASPGAISVAEIENSLFTELYDGQQNIVDWRIGGKSQTIYFSKNDTWETVYP